MTPARRYKIALYSPDRARHYDGRTREAEGIGGGIVARLSIVEALAALGHGVTAYVHCAEPIEHRGVRYIPLDDARRIECDVFIAISTGGDRTFAPLALVDVSATLRILWVQGVPQPEHIDRVRPDHVYVASHFLREVCATRWRVPAGKIFVCYNGIHQPYFEAVDAAPPPRDPYGIAYIGPAEKGLSACIGVLRRLRSFDDRFHLDVFGGDRLWGATSDGTPHEPGVTFKGLLGQPELARELYRYEYCLALQAMEEGFGMAVQEAKRAGAIVLASPVGAFKELIQHRLNGFLIDGPHEQADTQRAAAHLISDLADDPLRRQRIRRRAFRTPWSWSVAARTWIEHWDHVLGHGEDAAAQSQPVAPTVSIAAYYGHGNLGDESVLAVMLDELQRSRPDDHVVVATADPAATGARHDVSTVDERQLESVATTFEQSAAVWLGGGGLFHDTFGTDETVAFTRKHWGPASYATFAGLAASVGTPVYVVGAGASVHRTDAGRRYTRAVFEVAQLATIRDEDSRAALATAGADLSRTVVTADPAFLLPSADRHRARLHLGALGVPASQPFVAVALRDWDREVNGRSWESAVAHALDAVVTSRHVAVVLVPFFVNDDVEHDDGEAAARIRGQMRQKDAAVVAGAAIHDSPSLVQAVFQESAAVLLMRLHALILAANAGAPFVALRYDDKVATAANLIGCGEDVIDLARVSSDMLSDRITRAMDSRDRFEAALARTLPGIRAAARRSVALVVAAVDAGKPAPPILSADARGVFSGAASIRTQPAANQPETAGIVQAVGRAIVPKSWRRPLRNAWRRGLASPAAFAFDAFKRERMRTFGADLAGVHAGGEAGLVSIVLPVWNGAAFLREAIESILEQTYTAFELLIVDDGSTDDSGRIADEFAARDGRVRVMHSDHVRLPAALNRGFDQARGEFLTWASADNRLTPDALARLVDCLRRRPAWDAVYANLDLIGEEGRALTGSPHFASYQRPHGSAHIELPASTSELNTRDNNFIGAGFLYRRRAASLLGGYSPARFGVEDYDFWMRANALLTLRHADFDRPVVEYRFHGRSLTARAEDLGLADARVRLMVFDHFRRDCCLWPVVWVFPDTRSQLVRGLEQRAREAGHVIHDGSFPAGSLPSPWVPVAIVTIGDGGPARGDVEAAGAVRVRLKNGDDFCASIDESGWIVAPDLDRLFHSIDIGVRARITRQIETLASAPPATSLTASVVICAGRAVASLPRAVEAALGQDFSSGDFEVIVVDNAPGDSGLASMLAALPAGVRIVPCPIRGHSAARNAGLGAARGRYICYLDDDSIPQAGWLSRICGEFDRSPRTGVVGGPIRLKLPSPRPADVAEGWEHYWSHFEPRPGELDEGPWGANWAARRDVLFQIGGFRLAFGRRDNDHRGGEELVAAALAKKLGYLVGVQPEAVVDHEVDPSRFTSDHVRETMLTRHLVAHMARRDLLDPGSSSVASGLARLLLHHVDPSVRSWRHVARDVAYRKRAQFRLLAAQMRDLRERWQRGPDED